MERGQDLIETASLRGADEEELTLLRLFDAGKGSDYNFSVFNTLPVQALQGRPKGVFPENADGEGGYSRFS